MRGIIAEHEWMREKWMMREAPRAMRESWQVRGKVGDPEPKLICYNHCIQSI